MSEVMISFVEKNARRTPGMAARIAPPAAAPRAGGREARRGRARGVAGARGPDPALPPPPGRGPPEPLGGRGRRPAPARNAPLVHPGNPVGGGENLVGVLTEKQPAPSRR